MVCCSICERVTPRLAHANAAVVLSAVKVSIDSGGCNFYTVVGRAYESCSEHGTVNMLGVKQFLTGIEIKKN